MSYMLLIVEPTGQRRERGVEAGQQVYERMLQFTAGLQARGVLEASNSLASRGVRLQVREGRTQLTDGPFAEAKEMVGGFFLLNVATREEALAIAATCPAAEWCTVEVRQVGPCYEPDP
ncbi:YciI family protein [Methylibium sp.]|uniref:YciI family protein n=1 Tax=Methylibium sp. TaxID=2067992 RepID=UPI003D0E383C